MNPVDMALRLAIKALVDISKAEGVDIERAVYGSVRAQATLDQLTYLVPSLVVAAKADAPETPSDDQLH
jgi:hypothetical protein